jgi:hypothetical protein
MSERNRAGQPRVFVLRGSAGKWSPPYLYAAEATSGPENVAALRANVGAWLANGYMHKRQLREALGHEERALALAQAQGDAQLAAALQKAVDYYRQLAQAAKE